MGARVDTLVILNLCLRVLLASNSREFQRIAKAQIKRCLLLTVISVIKLQANGDDIELLQVHRHNTKIDGTKIDEMSLIASRPAACDFGTEQSIKTYSRLV